MDQKKWRKELACLIKEAGLKKGVELGVYRGRSFYRCLQDNPQLELTGIDTWSSSKGYPQLRVFFYEMVCRAIALMFGQRARLIKGDVNVYANDFTDGSLDFVHYDLFNFRLSNVDLHETVLRNWIPKIRENGILVGRDFSERDINAALKNLGVEYQFYINEDKVSQKLLYTTIHHKNTAG